VVEYSFHLLLGGGWASLRFSFGSFWVRERRAWIGIGILKDTCHWSSEGTGITIQYLTYILENRWIGRKLSIYHSIERTMRSITHVDAVHVYVWRGFLFDAP
jgi:hypothetical protein